jgi:hypothetical protein
MLYKEVVTSIGLGTPDNQVLIDSMAKTESLSDCG